MKQIKILVFVLIAISSCSKKSLPQNPQLSNPCDSLITSLTDSIKKVKPKVITKILPGKNIIKNVIDTIQISDTSDCTYYQLKALEIAAKYNTAIKEVSYYKSLSESRAKKIVNTVNINSNNDNRKKKSDNIDNSIDNKKSNVGDGNSFKPKGSATGDGNKIDNSKKLGWFWIFMAGALSWFIIQNVVLRVLKTYFPFLRIFF